MPSKKNEAMLQDFSQILDKYSDFFITENKGMTVSDISTLRKKLLEHGSKYKIVKNRVFKIALKNKNISDVDSFLKESNGILFVNDPIKDAKALASFLKDAKDKLVIKAGYTEGKIVDASYINTLSTLASKEELVAKLLMILKNPVQRLAIALSAIAKQKED